MKNRSMIYIVLNFLLLQTSTSTYSTDTNATYSMKEQITYTFDDLIRMGREAEDRRNREEAEGFYEKAYRYKELQNLDNYSKYVAAVVTHDAQRERTFSAELDQEKQVRKVSKDADRGNPQIKR